MSYTKRFQRKIEDFVCEYCGFKVIGNGYTNHCPECLYSKHVDVNPGDRAAECGGMMYPKSLELKNDVFYIVQECLECGHVRKNKAEKGDNYNRLVELSRSDE